MGLGSDQESVQLDHELHAQFEYESAMEAADDAYKHEHVPDDGCVGMANGCACDSCTPF